MRILIVHQNFPGQFPHIADALVARGDEVVAIGGPTAKPRAGVALHRWSSPKGTTPGIFAHAVRAEADLIRGAAAAQVARALVARGFVPDVIVGHPGWGETVHLKQVWPAARLILLGEYFYRTRGGDTGFDPEFGLPSFDEDLRIGAKNAVMALAYLQADAIVCPTRWQASGFPETLHPRIVVQHEGIDLARASRRAGATVTLPSSRVLDGARPVVTFVNRTLEPLRGFHIVMRALPAFLDAVPDAEVLVIGREGASGYGAPAPGGGTWAAALLGELGDRLDRSRVHFMGPVPHSVLIDAFSIAWAHVYYSYPFVLGWSLVEAMACECPVIASDTPPLHDAVEDGASALLLPFFDVAALSEAMVRVVRDRDLAARLGSAARRSALARFDRDRGVARWLDLIGRAA